MSIYSIMAFNSAVKQAQDNDNQTQNVQAKKVQTQQAQEELDLNKKLDQAKIKQARNEGMMSDYIGDQLEKHLNDQYKAKNDQLDAASGLQDMAEHKAQTAALQAKQVATQLHASDPDVQAHVQTLAGIMAAQSMGQKQPAPAAPAQGAQSPLPSIPGIAPVQGGASPQNVGQQVAPEAAAQPQTPEESPQDIPTFQQPTQQSQSDQSSQSIDLSPVEQAFGMPKGSMWLNPSTMKPEVNPLWKSKIEKQQTAEANYGVDSPHRMFEEEQRQDKNIKTAETYLVNSLKSRGGAIGLQNNKVDAAIHARALINQSYDPATGNYNISQVPYGELSESMGALLSGQSGSSEGRIAALKQKTAQGDINAVVSYFTGKPSNATSQDAIKQLVHIIDRQGEVSEDLRDNAFDKMKKLPTFSRLDADSLEALKSQHLGNSFKEELKNAPDKQGAPQGQQSGDSAFIQNARSHGYSDADIQAYLAKKNRK